MRTDRKRDFAYFCGVAVILGACALYANAANAEYVYAPDAGIDFTTNKVSNIIGVIDYSMLYRFYLEEQMTANLPGDRLIIISSPGGSMEIGNNMLSLIDQEKANGTRIICAVVGGASSMAFNILTHCDVRISSPDATFIVHPAEISELPGSERHTAHNLRKVAKMLETYDAPFRFDNAKAMGLSLSKYDTYANAETEWQASKLLEIGYLAGFCILSK